MKADEMQPWTGDKRGQALSSTGDITMWVVPSW